MRGLGFRVAWFSEALTFKDLGLSEFKFERGVCGFVMHGGLPRRTCPKGQGRALEVIVSTAKTISLSTNPKPYALNLAT